MRPILTLLFIALFALAGCDQPPRSSIALGVSSAARNLDPRFATDAVSERLNRLLYTALVEMDAAKQPVAGMASWQRLNPRHYRFRLKAHRRAFVNAQELFAEDVKATYDTILAADSASPLKGALKNIQSVQVVDKQTVDFFLHKADRLFPAYLTVGILPKKLIDNGHLFAKHPLGSGPFEFVSWINKELKFHCFFKNLVWQKPFISMLMLPIEITYK